MSSPSQLASFAAGVAAEQTHLPGHMEIVPLSCLDKAAQAELSIHLNKQMLQCFSHMVEQLLEKRAPRHSGPIRKHRLGLFVFVTTVIFYFFCRSS